MDNLNNIELRRLSTRPELRMESEVREDGTTLRYVSGYAVVFEQYSKPFRNDIVEIISRTAFDNTDMSDVVMLVDHSRLVGDVLARSKNGEGSLEISIDDIGVKFRFAVPDTSVGRDVVALIERGDITECSFAFLARKDSWRHDMMVEGKRYKVRRIEDVARLSDLSIVVKGQYSQTSVGIDERSLAMRARELARPKDVARQMSVGLAKAITDTF